MAKRIFISFAVEDKWARDYLVGQAQNARVPFDFTDYSIKEALESMWKTRCRERIKGCHGVIALISKRTRLADGAKWEMQCAIDEKIPIIGVHVSSDDKGETPSQLDGKRVINWTWDGIKNFLDRL